VTAATTWLPDTVASLVPNALPTVTAAASSPLYSCSSYSFCASANTPCVPGIPGTKYRYLVAYCANGWGEWPIGCCTING
jgi:hypothetical protein